MKTKIGSLLSLSFIVFLFFPATAQAKIQIGKDFQGMLVITMPHMGTGEVKTNGEVIILEPGDTIPDIPSGSTLEVAEGNFTVTADAPDNVTISCLNHSSSLGNGASVNLGCGPSSGLVKVLKSSIVLLDEDKKEIRLKEGDQYEIIAKALKTTKDAPATAAGELPGNPVKPDAPPVDSRDLPSSP